MDSILKQLYFNNYYTISNYFQMGKKQVLGSPAFFCTKHKGGKKRDKRKNLLCSLS